VAPFVFSPLFAAQWSITSFWYAYFNWFTFIFLQETTYSYRHDTVTSTDLRLRPCLWGHK